MHEKEISMDEEYVKWKVIKALEIASISYFKSMTV